MLSDCPSWPRWSMSAFLVAAINGLVLAVTPAICVAQGPAQVQVMPTLEREVAPTIRLVGAVRPCIRTVVAAEVQGLVSEMPVDVGDLVVKGQVVCKLRALPKRLALEESRATLARMAATLQERKAGLALAEFEKDRIAGLWSNRRCTEKELRVTQTDYDAWLGRVAQAEHDRVAQQATVQLLSDDLARTEIVAPCDGYIVDKRTEIGSWVNRGGEVVELVDLSTVRVRVAVPERLISFCGIGSEAGVTVEALDKTFAGRITRVIPDADKQARTFPIDIDIPNPTCELKAGMFVRAAVPSGPKTKRLLVPKDALVIRGPAPMIYVVHSTEQGQMAAPMPVKVVAEVRDHVAVQAMGLTSGDLVIVRGNEFMFGPGPVIAIPMPGGSSQPHGDSEAPGETVAEPVDHKAKTGDGKIPISQPVQNG